MKTIIEQTKGLKTKRSWEIKYSNDNGKTFNLYKNKLTFDEANKESFIIEKNIKFIKLINKV
jgi:hypothetical protein